MSLTPSQLEDLTKRLVNQYQSSLKVMRTRNQLRMDNYNLYVGKKPTRRYKSEANIHVPYTKSLLDTAHALLTSFTPLYTIETENYARDSRASKLAGELVRTAYDVNDFDAKFSAIQKASMLFDTGWAYVGWKFTGKDDDYICIDEVNPFNVIPHTRKQTLDDEFPIFIYYEKTKPQLEAMGCSKEAIAQLTESKLSDTNYQRQQAQAYGYSYNPDSRDDGLFPVIACWGKIDLGDDSDSERVKYIIIGNEQTILNTNPPTGKSQFESPFKHNHLPFAVLPYDRDPMQFLGQSFITPISDMQLELNALENMKNDNYLRRNNPPLKVRRGSGIDLSTLRFVNSIPWEVDEMTDIEFMVVPDLAPSIEAQQNNVKQTMQQASKVNDLMLVANDVSIQGSNTATGATIANETTKTSFKTQLRFINSFSQRVGELCVALLQDENLFDREKAVAIADEEGRYYEEMVDPNILINAKLRFKVVPDSSMAESKESKYIKATNLKALYEGDPTINQDELDRGVIENAGYDYNKVKKPTSDRVPELTDQLNRLVNVAQDPSFANFPEAQKQEVLRQIEQLKGMLEQLSGGVESMPQPPETMEQPLPSEEMV